MNPLANFTPVTAADRALFESYLSRLGGELSCEYCFATLLSWGPIYKFLRCDDGERLWIYGAHLDDIYFPLGEPVPPAELAAISTQFHSAGLSGTVDQVPLTYAETHRAELEKTFKMEWDEGYWDYVYSTTQLATFPGSQLSRKRNLIRRFEKLYPNWAVRPMSGGDEMRWLEPFINEWAVGSGNDSKTVEEDMASLRHCFAVWGEGVFSGLVLAAGSEPAGFCIWSEPSRDMAVMHFKKALRRFDGAAQMIIHAAAKHLDGRIKWINQEQDMADEGLRHAKRSYGPAHLIKACWLTRNDSLVGNNKVHGGCHLPPQ
jgi:uncharacterized protein